MKLVQTRDSRKTDSFEAKAKQFNSDAAKTFDIFCEDVQQRRKLENDHGLKMTWNGDFLQTKELIGK